MLFKFPYSFLKPHVNFTCPTYVSIFLFYYLYNFNIYFAVLIVLILVLLMFHVRPVLSNLNVCLYALCVLFYVRRAAFLALSISITGNDSTRLIHSYNANIPVRKY